MRSARIFAAVGFIASVAMKAAPSQQPSTSRKITDTGPDWISGIAEPASGRFVVCADAHAIRILNRQTGKTTTVPVKVRDVNGSLSISSSGHRLIFPVDDDTKPPTQFSGKPAYIWTLDLDTLSGAPVGEPHRVSLIPSRFAAISHDGRWIALLQEFPPRGFRLLVMPSDGGDERMLDSVGRINTPRFSADGKSIYYIRGRGHGPALARVSVAGGAPDSLAPAEGVIGVSRDGSRIAYTAIASTQSVATIADTNAKEIARVLFNATIDRLYSFAGRSNTTLLGARLLEPGKLETISLADGKATPYGIDERYGSESKFSPNRYQLAFLSTIDGHDQFVVYDLKTKSRRVVPTAADPERYAWQWSPDGSRLAFLATNVATLHHDLYALEVSTGRATRLADMRSGRRSTATLYRWRADSKSIDYIVGTSPLGDAPVELRRVTVTGADAFVRSLPSSPEGDATSAGYRLVNDTLVIIGKSQDSHDFTPKLEVVAIPVPAGEPHQLTGHAAYWLVGASRDVASPDGKWIALGSEGLKDNKPTPQLAVVSTDGKTFRLLGSPMGCDVWPVEWLPDSRALIAVGASSCTDWREDAFIVPVDGGPAKHIDLPPNLRYTLTPDGHSLLVTTEAPKIGSIMEFDASKSGIR